MVHTRPSIGCQKCRQRHTRCDRTRPGCLRCSRLGVECPGYRDNGGFIFKHQTTTVQNRQSNKTNQQMSRINSPVPDPSISIQFDPATASMALFFNLFLSTKRDPLTSRCHFDYLTKYYQESPASSPIVLAAQCMAVRTAANILNCQHSAELFLESLHLQAVRSLQQALSRRVSADTKAVVLAILYLDFADQIRFRSSLTRTGRTTVHIQGALALIGQEQCQQRFMNDDDRIGYGLISAIRSTALRLMMMKSSALDGRLRTTNLFSSIDRAQHTNSNPALQLNDIIEATLRLREAAVHSSISSIQLLDQVSSLNEWSLRWLDNIPSEWAPAFAPRPTSQLEPRQPVSMDVVATVSQWRCSRLMILKLQLHLLPVGQQRTSLQEEANDILGALCESTSYVKEITNNFDSQHVLGVWYLDEILEWAEWVIDDFMEGGQQPWWDQQHIDCLREYRAEVAVNLQPLAVRIDQKT